MVAAGVCLCVGLFYALNSPGTYQDDDLDRYYMARQVWRDPGLLIDRWGMPAAMIVYAIPARAAGYSGLEVTTVVVTTAAAVATGLAAQAAGMSFPWLALAFLFFQPLVLDLSYSGLAEPLAALILSLVLWEWYRGRRGRSVLMAGLLPLARIDMGLLTVATLAAGWRAVSWRVRAGAVLPLLLWNAVGFVTTGEPLFVFGLGGSRPLNSLGPFHYVQNIMSVVGPVVIFFVVWAVVARAVSGSRVSAKPGFPAFALVLALVHLVELSLLAWEALPFGRSIGFLRHLVASSPATALVAVWAFGNWFTAKAQRRPLRIFFALGWTALAFALLSHELIGHTIVGEGRREYVWIVTGILGIAGVLYSSRKTGIRRTWIAAGVAVLACGLSLVTVRPIALDSERTAIQKAVEHLEKWHAQNSVVYTNHPWFVFLSGRDRYDKGTTPPLTKESLKNARPGSFVLWENHYGNRLWGDVPIAWLQQDPRFEPILQLTAGENDAFQVAVFRRKE